MFKNLSDNLNILMAKARLNSNELSKLTGLPATTIKRIRNNEQANPTISTLLPLANYFSVSLNEFIGSELYNEQTLKPVMTNGLNTIPLLSWRECIHFNLLDYSKLSKKILTERKTTGKAFALRIEDEDLIFFPKNSLLIIEPEIKPESGDYVIVVKAEQGLASIKKYILETDQVYLKSLISGLSITQLAQDYMILGVVIQYKGEMKPELSEEKL